MRSLAAHSRINPLAPTRNHTHYKHTCVRLYCRASEHSTPPSELPHSCWAILEEFTRAEFKGVAHSTFTATKESREELKSAFCTAIQTRNDAIGWNGPASSTVLLGILSSDIRMALRSLRDYTEALGVEYVLPEYVDIDGRRDSTMPLPSIQGAVYLRYRAVPARPHEEQSESISPQCTVTKYNGPDRGVLVNFGTMQVGHLPLGLLDPDRVKPASPTSR
jgi:hypothetical protein